MNLFEIALISLALAFDTSGICFAAGYKMRKSEAGSILQFLFLLVTTQLIFFLLGLLLGTFTSGLFPKVVNWIALSILIVMGLKIILGSFQSKPDDLGSNPDEFRGAFRISLSAGLAPFIIATGIGLLLPLNPNIILVVGITFLLFSSAWIVIGKAKVEPPLKSRLGMAGGLILLAAGLHLFIKIIR